MPLCGRLFEGDKHITCHEANALELLEASINVSPLMIIECGLWTNDCMAIVIGTHVSKI